MADDSLSDEDKELFRAQMRGVNPLKHTNKITQPKATINTPLPRIKKKAEPPSIKDSYLSDYISESVLSNSILSYCHPSIPSKRFRELRHGEIAWEARLDLHGLKTDNARAALSQFIQAQTAAGHRCVLIIHGKGGHEGAHPVIKNLVNRWLPQFDEVLAFHSALPRHGSFGAVYVLLKKNN